MRLTLKPFGSVDREILDHLRGELRRFGDVVVAEAAPMPADGFDPERGQYRATSFFPACRAEPGARVLGITEADIYDEDLRFVFGYAMIGDRPAVVSLARLRGPRAAGGRKRLSARAKRRFLDRTVKESVHEIGHTLGLAHDEYHPECVMYYSRRLRDTDRKERAYCPTCAPKAEVTLKLLGT